MTGEVSFPSVNVTLPFGNKNSVCDCQFLVVSLVMEFNPFYVGGSDDEEEGFNNNEIDRSENNESLNSLNNNDEEPDNVKHRKLPIKFKLKQMKIS